MGWNGSGKRLNITQAKGSAPHRRERNLKKIFIVSSASAFLAFVILLLVLRLASNVSQPSDSHAGRGLITDRSKSTSKAIQELKEQAKLLKPRAKRTAEIIPGKPPVDLPQITTRRIVEVGSEHVALKYAYRNATEQLLMQTFSCPLGLAPRPIGFIPAEDRQDMINILAMPVKIEDDDDEDTRIGKEIIADAKKELIQYIADGGDPNTFFQYYYDELVKAYELHNEVQEEVRRLAEEEKDPDLARQFMKKANEMLTAEGIAPVSLDIESGEQENE